jgi:hypothetical protein
MAEEEGGYERIIIIYIYIYIYKTHPKLDLARGACEFWNAVAFDGGGGEALKKKNNIIIKNNAPKTGLCHRSDVFRGIDRADNCLQTRVRAELI